MKIKIHYLLELNNNEMVLTGEEIKREIEKDINDEFEDWVKEVNVEVLEDLN